MNLTKLIKREIFITSVAVLVVLSAFSLITYALFFTVSEGSTNTINFGDITMNYCSSSSCESDVSNMGQVIGYEGGSLRLFYPEEDLEALERTPYRFKLTNTGDYTLEIKIKLKKEASPILNSSYSTYTSILDSNIKVALGEETTSKGYSPGINLYSDIVDNVIGTYTLAAGESKIFNLWTWLKSDAPNEAQGTYFIGNIQVQGEYTPKWATGCNEDINTIGCTIIKDNTVQDGNALNFAQTALQSNTQGLFKTTEKDIDYYFFRGGDYCKKTDNTIDTTNTTQASCTGTSSWTTLNNNLIFGGFCWQIIRTNEDGSVRVLYNGIPSDGKCNNVGNSTEIEKSEFNHIISGAMLPREISTIGYTLGNFEGKVRTQIKGPEYLHTETIEDPALLAKNYSFNENTGMFTLLDSKSLTDIQTYSNQEQLLYKYTCGTTANTCNYLYEIIYEGTPQYNNNDLVINKSYRLTTYWSSSEVEATANEISSTIKTKLETWYANNLATNFNAYITDAGYCNDRTISSNANGTYGFGENNIYFSSYNRILTTYEPTIYCPNPTRDLYTVSTSNGNGHSNNPIGLITADEAIYAGKALLTVENTNSYLNTGNTYFTMTPTLLDSKGSMFPTIWVIYNTGRITYAALLLPHGVRPVISIKSSVKVIGGNGSKDNPYTLYLE